MNWSYVHPKHEGYQATPRAHNTGIDFLFKKLTIPEVCVTLLESFVSSERSNLLYEVGMGDDHPAAAVSLKAEIIEDSLGILACAHTLYIHGIG